MRLVIYARSTFEKEELEVAAKHFPIINYRTQVEAGDLVVCRYSLLPFAQDLEVEVQSLGGRLINTHREHQYVADLQNWEEDLRGMTPRTWFRIQDAPEEGPFVVKGQTNSRKDRWRTHMFAANRREATEVQLRLQDDNLFAEQKIYVREFVKLKTLGIDIGGAPVTLEYRFFVYRGRVLASGYYWANQLEDGKYWETQAAVPGPEIVPQAFLDSVLEKVAGKCPFLVLDVGILEDGTPIVIELNDGCMSGLSCVDPEVLYSGLYAALRAHY